ncbi:MAG: protein kinase [Candidatus Melainabacteria bacterium]|nr:protein kinase [Candidatus Melainabacteria bacterium]
METKHEQSAIPDELLRRYTDIRRLGSGAMGDVYRAHDSNLDIDVAIKLLKLRQIAPEMAVRFQQEAKLASKLKHHNLVTLLDFGISEKGEPYIIMENVNGRSLSAELERSGALSIPAAFNVMVQICDGMEHAHRAGIIHRDLKPSNVMVCGDDLDTASIKVLDFGIAKLDDSTGSITQTGAILGTPYYMSPEQFSGENVDRRTDVYAAGSMMFRLLTNYHPFEGDTLLEIMQEKQNDEAPLISDIEGCQEIPPEVEEVVAKALARDPDERYSSMKEFQDAMYLALDKMHIKLQQQSIPTPEKQNIFDPKKMRRFAKVILLVVMLIVAVTSLFLLKFRDESSDQKAAVVEVQKPIRSERPGSNPITDKVFSVTNGIWSAPGLVYDQDLEWIAANKDQHQCRGIVLGVADSTEVQNKITSRGWEAISRIPLRDLRLTNCFLKDDDLKQIAKIPTLRVLGLMGSGIGDNGIKYLENRPIEEIVLRGTKVTDKCIDSLATMRLKHVNLQETNITDVGYEKLGKIATIDWLDISATQGTSEGLKFINEMPRLKSLYIGVTPFGLSAIKNLSDLDLKLFNTDSNKAFNDQCLITIAKQWPNLESVNLNNTGITGEGLKQLPGKFQKVQVLHLSANALTDADILPVAQLPRLAILELMLNAITDKTPEMLAKVRSIQSVDLSHCEITPKGLEALKKAHKNYTEVKSTGQNEANHIINDLLQDEPML